MTEHVRTQIRKAVAASLTVALPGHTVFEARKYAINAEELPVVDIRFSNENADTYVMGNPKAYQRVVTMHIRVTDRATSEVLDDQMDAASVAIEHDMATGIALQGLAEDFQLMQTNFSDSGEGEAALAELVIRYDIMYQTASNNVTTPRS